MAIVSIDLTSAVVRHKIIRTQKENRAMNRVLLLGAGKIGGAIARFLTSCGDYDVLVADSDSAALRRLADSARVSTVTMSVSDAESLREAMSGRQAVLSA